MELFLAIAQQRYVGSSRTNLLEPIRLSNVDASRSRHHVDKTETAVIPVSQYPLLGLRPLLVGLRPLSFSPLLGLLLPDGVCGGAMSVLTWSGELSVSVASSAAEANRPRRICRGVCPMGAQMYAWLGSCRCGDASMCGGTAGCDGNGLCAWLIGCATSARDDSRRRPKPMLFAMMITMRIDRMKPYNQEGILVTLQSSETEIPA